jgi:anti-sigma-K factor RskA
VSDELRDLTAGEALGALSPEDRERLLELAAADPKAAARLDADRATVAALESGLARAEPDAGLFDRILAEVRPAPAPAPAKRRERRGWRRPRLAAVAASAIVAVGFAAALLVRGDEPDARAAVAGTERFPGVAGEARLYASAEPGGRLALDLENLPDPPAGHHYEVWVLRDGGGEMEAVGSFTPPGEAVELELPLPGPGEFVAVDVSLEPDGGSPEHSGISLAGGTFGS